MRLRSLNAQDWNTLRTLHFECVTRVLGGETVYTVSCGASWSFTLDDSELGRLVDTLRAMQSEDAPKAMAAHDACDRAVAEAAHFGSEGAGS